MKILFDHPSPFLLAHGGVQVQIEQTKLALEKAGIAVEFLRWWDVGQRGDLIHYFGGVSSGYLRMARQKNLPVVVTGFFSETCNRSDLRLSIQGLITRALLLIPVGESVKEHLRWRTLTQASHVVVGLESERYVLKRVYGVPDSRISVIPLGVTEPEESIRDASSEKAYLIAIGTICEVKGSVELARLAKKEGVSMLFIGDPFSLDSSYWREFQSLIDDRFVQHRGHISDGSEMAAVLRSARGFVLLSKYENWSLAAHEAAACGLPLLLPDMKWSRERFGNQAYYFAKNNPSKNGKILAQFYSQALSLRSPSIQIYTWGDVAAKLQAVYASLLG